MFHKGQNHYNEKFTIFHKEISWGVFLSNLYNICIKKIQKMNVVFCRYCQIFLWSMVLKYKMYSWFLIQTQNLNYESSIKILSMYWVFDIWNSTSCLTHKLKQFFDYKIMLKLSRTKKVFLILLFDNFFTKIELILEYFFFINCGFI